MGTDDDLDFGATLKGFTAGQKLSDRYALERILGKGGMGVVWLVKDEELKREIAMKFLPEMVVRDREAIAELKRETTRSLELTHANIVRIYDFVQGPNWAGITMERIDGETLSTLKLEEESGCFDTDKIAPWIQQLCAALKYAHEEARVVHRDLKPSNLMVSKNGRLKVADFGIAGTLTESMSRVSMRPTNSGTLVYMSPQQAMGEFPSVTDDIYSVGATIYDLLTGKPPFYSGDIIRQVREKEPTPMNERRNRLQIQGKTPIPKKWEAAVRACLDKDAAQRPQSIADFSEMLFGDRPVPPRKAPATVDAPAMQTAPAKASQAPHTPITRVPQTSIAQTSNLTDPQKKPAPNIPLLAGIGAAVAVIGIVAFVLSRPKPDTTAVVTNASTPTPIAAAGTPALIPPRDLESLDAASLEKLAQGGNNAAQGLLALWYMGGYKTHQDYKSSLAWATQASNANDAIGEFTLASLYALGDGVAQNPLTASTLAAKALPALASIPGNAAAYCLGIASETGLGAPKDSASAFAIFQKLSQGNYAFGQYALGWMYAAGDGIPVDWPRARTLFEQAAGQGIAAANVNLALMYEGGKGVMANQQQAVDDWQQAAQLGDSVAQENLGRMYRTGDRVPEQPATALAFYQKAADQGDAQAMYALAWMIGNGEGTAKDSATAATWEQKAAPLTYSAERALLTLVYSPATGAKPAPLDPALAGSWVSASANASAGKLYWQQGKDGHYTFGGNFNDSGLAGGSEGLLLMTSTNGNEKAEIAYEIHGNTLNTYSPIGPAQWTRQSSSDDSDNGDGSSASRAHAPASNGDEDQSNSTGKKVYEGFSRSRGYGGFGGFGY